MTEVVNVHTHDVTVDDVYIGRPSKWGNPFSIGKDGTRDEVIKKYKDYFLSNKELLADIEELRGKNLVCYCKPQACHGDVLKAALDVSSFMSYFETDWDVSSFPLD